MRYRPRQYAEALAAASENKSEIERHTVTQNFLALLQKHRMLAKLDRILHEYERLVLRRDGLHKVRLEYAGGDPNSIAREIAQAYHGKAAIETVERPELLAGVRMLIDDELLIDASGRRQVERMFE